MKEIVGYPDTRTVFIDGKKLSPSRSQEIFNHSPDGFSWGYCGSGPAQLALAILMEFIPVTCALKLYQRFKTEIVSGLAINRPFLITADAVRAWIRPNLKAGKLI